MKDSSKPKQTLTEELASLRRRIRELEQSEVERKKIAESLRESEARYHSLVDHSIDAVLLTSPDGKILSANPEACRIFGRTEEEICQMGRAGIMDLRDPRLAAALEERDRTGQFRGELVFVRKDGTPFLGDISSVIFKDHNGNAKTSMIIRDITERKRAEEALREIEKKYRLLAENVTDVIFVLDMNLNYTYITPSVKLLRGYEPEEVLRQPSMETLTPSSWNLAVKTLSEVMDLEKSERGDISLSRMLQLEMNRKDGTTVWTEVTFSFVRDEVQRPVGILGVTRDITERKLVETRQERLAKILDSSLNEIYVFNSVSLRFEYVNQGALRNLGYTHEAMLRMTPVNLKPEFTEASFRQTVMPLLQREQEILIFNTVHRRADASLYPVEVHLQLVELDGQQVFLAVILDITERKRAEETLQETRNYLENLIEYANAPIIVWDPHLKITRFNQAFEKLTGRKASDVIGKELDLLFPDDSRDDSLHHIHQTTTGKRWDVIEIPILHVEGSVRTVLWNSAAIYNTAGSKIIAIIAQGQDITERKRAEERITEQLQELQRWYDVMLGREDRVLELKKEVNDLLSQAGHPPRYMSTKEESEF